MNMKKIKQISALVGVILLVAMYLITLISAIFSTPATAGLFKASMFCTIAVPALLYGYMLIYKVLKKHAELTRFKYETEQKKDKKLES